MNKLKIAYVTVYDAQDVNQWSGLPFYISETIKKYIGEIEFIGNLKSKYTIKNIYKKIYYKFVEQKYFLDRTEENGKYYASQVKKKIKGKSFDLIFAPGTIPIAYLDICSPIFFWTDANFHGMLNYYFTNLCKETIYDGDKMEKIALEKSSLAIYSSEWAANGTINYYKINPEKVIVIPFGANISNIPSKDELKYKLNKEIQLLFVGKDWERKGGAIAFETLKKLNELGVNAHLTVVGCIPPQVIEDNKMTVIPFLDKNKKEDEEFLRKLYLSSDFFLMPSRKECYGVVFCEAAAFGLPVLSTITGGIPTIVKDGINGYLLPKEATGNDFANKIIEIMDNNSYEKLSISSRQRYEEILNWDSAGQKLREEIQRIL
jgi:glycosyltransferase involved in cell wall biosynthesis